MHRWTNLYIIHTRIQCNSYLLFAKSYKSNSNNGYTLEGYTLNYYTVLHCTSIFNNLADCRVPLPLPQHTDSMIAYHKMCTHTYIKKKNTTNSNNARSTNLFEYFVHCINDVQLYFYCHSARKMPSLFCHRYKNCPLTLSSNVVFLFFVTTFFFLSFAWLELPS